MKSKKICVPLQIDIFILGAGPAGLSTIYTLQKNNISNYLLVDFGKPLEEREKYDNEDAFLGSGGAGLYSDGKFSFYPCGTKVWDLPNKEKIQKSYKILETLFQESVDFKIPSFILKKEEFNQENELFNLKEYPSFYLSFEKRKQLIRFLSNSGELENKILMKHKIVQIEKLENEEKYFVKIKNVLDQNETSIFCKFIVLGGGKFFPIHLQKIYKLPVVFRRLEFGGRILANNKTLSSLFPENYQEKNLIDPKWVYASKNLDVEYRTFCMCVDGETVLCKYNGIKGYSGRSDCFPTGFTNFGFNIIVRKPNLVDLDKFLIKDGLKEYEISLADALCEKNKYLEELYGELAGRLLLDGLKFLTKQFDIDVKGIKMIGPTLEGVGYYPQIKDDLSLINDDKIFMIGDSTGIFRGIIPSMISGIYVALSILESLNSHKIKL